jgi:hypothetical protein
MASAWKACDDLFHNLPGNTEQRIPLLSGWARAWSTTPAAMKRSNTHGQAAIARGVDISISHIQVYIQQAAIEAS